MRSGALLLAALTSVACGSEIPAAERGEEIFNDPSFSGSSLNTASCATCHRVTETPAGDRIDPGHTLFGVAAREWYWGDQRVYNLSEAVNLCYRFFMRAGRDLDEESADARALYEYLVSITPDGSPTEALPVTVVEHAAVLPLGNAASGQVLYDAACASCHGAAHTGDGSILRDEVILPEYTDIYPCDFPDFPPAQVVVEKVRHGRFFDVGGFMPFYALEMLSDEDLADIITFLDVPREIVPPPASCP